MNINVICETKNCLNFSVSIFFEEEADIYVCGVCMNEITNKTEIR